MATIAKAPPRSSSCGRKYVLLLLLVLLSGLLFLRTSSSGPMDLSSYLPASTAGNSNEASLTELHEMISILNKTLRDHFKNDERSKKANEDNAQKRFAAGKLETTQLKQQVEELKSTVAYLKTKTRGIEPAVSTGTAASTSNNNVTSSFEQDLQAARQGTLPKFKSHSLFGFYQSVYKQPKASVEVLNLVRRHMAETPVYLVSSAGYHYDPLAKRHESHVRYTYDHINAATWLPQNRPNGFDDVRNLQRWLDHFYVAALWCNCDYLIFMEDDTLLRGAITMKPPHDAGGMEHKDFHWIQELQDKYGAGNWSYYSHGMCGGAYLRVEAFLDVYKNLNWTRVGEMKDIDERIGRHSDITLALLMMDAGYILKPWNETKRKYHRGSATAKLIHADKSFYDKPLRPYDGPVISDVLNETEKRW